VRDEAAPWHGCWFDRLALKALAISAKTLSRSEDDRAQRDVFYCAGRLFIVWRTLADRRYHSCKLAGDPGTLGLARA